MGFDLLPRRTNLPFIYALDDKCSVYGCSLLSRATGCVGPLPGLPEEVSSSLTSSPGTSAYTRIDRIES